jgi:Zn-dependent protease
VTEQNRWLPPVPAPPVRPPEPAPGSDPAPAFGPSPALEPAVEATATDPAAPAHADHQARSRLGKAGPIAVALVAFAGKFKTILLALSKAKFLVSSGTMLVSVAAYATIWGWRFALGFVLLLLVHEYGHVIQLRREGVRDASAPIFIPFLGALIWAKSLGRDAAAEARTALAGPILGSLGALACVGLYLATDNDLFRALAFTGFFINLFNLIPVGFLDGARAAAAMSPWLWLLGVFGMALLILAWPNPFILLIGLLSILETYRRFKQFRAGGEEVRAYYGIARRDRILISATYLLLIAALTFAIDATHLERRL